MEKIEARVDEKGRILIPVKVRRKMQIKPLAKVDIRIERIHPRKSFLDVADEIRGTLKGKDAVKLLHEESPFR